MAWRQEAAGVWGRAIRGGGRVSRAYQHIETDDYHPNSRHWIIPPQQQSWLVQHQHHKLVDYPCKSGASVMSPSKLAIDISPLMLPLHVCVRVHSCLLRSLPRCAAHWPFPQNTVTITHIPWIVNERTNYRSASDTPLHNYQSKAACLSVALQRRANQSIT